MTQSKTLIITAAALAVAVTSQQVRAADVVAEGDVRNQGQPITGSQGPALQTGFLQVGPEAPGRVSVLDGGTLDTNGGISLGISSAASGVLQVDGFGSLANIGGNLDVGVNGGGIVRVTDGGALSTFADLRLGVELGGTGTGTLAVLGAGSTFRAGGGLVAAPRGTTGRLDVADGGRATFERDLRLGGFDGGSGEVVVGGVGSSLNVGNLVVDGGGTLRLLAGGTAAARQDVSLLYGGALVLDGGTLTAADLFVNPLSRVEGSGTVRGRLGLLENAQLAVDLGGRIAFDAGNVAHRIDGLAQVGRDGTLSFAAGLGEISPTGQLVTRGGELRALDWQNQGNLAVLDNGTTTVVGTFNNLDGRVSVSGNSSVEFLGALTNNGTFDVRPGSTATFLGRVNGAGGFAGGGDYVFLGAFAPGNSPTISRFDGDLTLGPDSVLEIELFGTTSDLFDQVIVSGDAVFQGELQVLLGNDYLPQIGDEFEFFTANSITGDFRYDTFTAGNGVSLDLIASPTSLRFVAVPEPTTLALAGVGGLLMLRRRRA